MMKKCTHLKLIIFIKLTKLINIIVKYQFEMCSKAEKYEKRLTKTILKYLINTLISNPELLNDNHSILKIRRNLINLIELKYSPSYIHDFCNSLKGHNPKYNQVFTITFGDRGENHVGNQIVGKQALRGFKLVDLIKAQNYFESREIECEIVKIHNNISHEEEKELDICVPKAYILVVRNGLKCVVDPDEFYDEQDSFEKDRKAFMHGAVKNKLTRANLMFDSKHQNADYENKKGTIYAWEEAPLLNKFRKEIPNIIGEVGKNMIAEGNYYEKLNIAGIGWHGDKERVKVAAIRVGSSMNLCYQWFYKNKIVGDILEIILHHGDLYFMSEEAVGTHWNCSSKVTLRHCAGTDKHKAYKPNWF